MLNQLYINKTSEVVPEQGLNIQINAYDDIFFIIMDHYQICIPFLAQSVVKIRADPSCPLLLHDRNSIKLDYLNPKIEQILPCLL